MIYLFSDDRFFRSRKIRIAALHQTFCNELMAMLASISPVYLKSDSTASLLRLRSPVSEKRATASTAKALRTMSNIKNTIWPISSLMVSLSKTINCIFFLNGRSACRLAATFLSLTGSCSFCNRSDTLVNRFN